MHNASYTIGDLPQDPKILIASSFFHREMTESMLKACKETLSSYGVENITVVEAPGAFEIPLLIQRFLQQGSYDSVIVLGVILKGDTMHFELVANECARGCMDVMLATSTPIVFEVLAAYDTQQALERSQGEHNKGKEAALSALTLLSTFHNQNL